MASVLQTIRCRLLLAHKWEEKRIDGEKAFECRRCHKRYFGAEPPSGDMRTLTGGG